MVTDDTFQVIQPEDFWWKPNENINLFTSPNIIYNYQPYSFKFIESVYPNMIRIRVFIYLDILLGNTILLDAGLIVDYNININSVDNIKSQILRIEQDANDKFNLAFQDRRHQLCISPTFAIQFDPLEAQTKINNGLTQEGTL